MSNQELFKYYKDAGWEHVYMIGDFIYIGTKYTAYIMMNVTSVVNKCFILKHEFDVVLLYYMISPKLAHKFQGISRKYFYRSFYDKFNSGEKISVSVMNKNTKFSEFYSDLLEMLPVYFLEDIFG